MDDPPEEFVSRYPEIVQKYSDTVSKAGLMRSLRRVAIRRPLWMYLLLLVSAVLITYSAQIYFSTNLSSDKNIFFNATSYVAAVGLMIGGYQAWLTSLSNQANFVKDFASKFFEKIEFYGAWYDLIYTFENRVFRQIDDAVISGRIKNMSDLERFNVDRKIGSRLWHPVLLQGTPEEARLDNLLGFLNVLGDYYDRGNLSSDEVGDATGYYLLGLANSEAFRAYLDAIAHGFSGMAQYKSGFGNSGVRNRYGVPPFRHLCFLLNEIAIRQKRREDEIYDLMYYRRKL
ncbi:hypothetical protein [uncultured Methylobacterium sp.]|jgi:hypothetical protein|uniref:hypothetical protein n=1 Tax=uncultured Methylobacterium sp. TaxID=157278 RepID=UPI00262C5EE5|nr:hypothetical protein [uncultured Methylobacterium sp.]